MTDLTCYPAASSDDGFVVPSTEVLANNLGSCVIGNQSGASKHGFFRFTNVTIPQGSEISVAYITFTAANTRTGTVCNLLLKAVDDVNPSAPTNYTEFTSLVWLATTVAWNAEEGWTGASSYNSDSIVTLLQEIINDESWVSGNSILIGVFDNSSDSDAYRTPIAYDNGSDYAELHITYDALSIQTFESMDTGDEVIHNWPEINESMLVDELLGSLANLNSSLDESTDGADSFFVAWDKDLAESFDCVDVMSGILNLILSLAETADSADVMDGIRYIYKTITESLFIWDKESSQWQLNVSESMAVTDTSTLYLVMVLREYMAALDVLSSKYTGTETLEETAHISDAISWLRVFNDTITESVGVTDTISPALVLMLIEYLSGRDEVVSQGTFTKSIIENLNAADSMVSQWLLTLLESFALADTATLCKVISETLDEKVTITDVLSSVGTFTLTLSEQIKLAEWIQNAYSLSLSESMAIAETSKSFNAFYNTLSESMGIADAITATITAYLSITENAIVVDSLSSTGTFYNTIEEAIKLNITIDFDSNVYECWVLNTPKFLPSIYSGFEFNSYATFGNRIFAALSSTGIFELTGDTDNSATIHTGVVLQETDFGTVQKKRFRRAYLGVVGDSPVLITKETDDNTQRVYTISDKGNADTARDTVGRRWVLSVADFDELESIKLVPIILSEER